MQVVEVLDKITERNAPIVGCIVKSDKGVFHNLEDYYALDCNQVADTVQELLDVTEYLEQETGSIDTVWTEFDGHCVIGNRAGDDVLIAVTGHLQRAGVKKLQVGLSLQTRMLTKALEESDPAVTAEPVAAPAAAVETTAVAPEPAYEEPEAVAEPEVEAAPVDENKGKKRRVYRGQVYWE